jgi:hypothetical protein
MPDDQPGTEAPVYHFPVHIEVIGELEDHHLDQVSQHIFRQLDDAMRANG